MSKRKQLSKRRLAVIDDLFAAQFDEQLVLDKHKVSRNTYNKWLTDANFTDELSLRIDSSHRQSELIIARYASLAAAKLVQLTESKSEETARKACLDIISLPKKAASKTDQSTTADADEQIGSQQLPPETVSRLLAALAEEKFDE